MLKNGLFVICERNEITGEKFLAKVAQYTPGDSHCYTIEYKLDRQKAIRGNSEFVVEVKKLTILPKEYFASTSNKTIYSVLTDFSHLLNNSNDELNIEKEVKLTKKSYSNTNKKNSTIEKTSSISSNLVKKRKYERKIKPGRKKKSEKLISLSDDEYDCESEWETYEPELWEKNDNIDPLIASQDTTSSLDNTKERFESTQLISINSTNETNKSQHQTITITQQSSSISISSSSSLISSSTTPSISSEPIKRQRKTRTLREPKKESESKKSEVRPETPTLNFNKNNLLGVVSCPNKRFKAVVEIKGKLVPVPGLFDSDIEAAVARDEFLSRKLDSTTITTFQIDQFGPLLYGFSVFDGCSAIVTSKKKGSDTRKQSEYQTSHNHEINSNNTYHSKSQNDRNNNDHNNHNNSNNNNNNNDSDDNKIVINRSNIQLNWWWDKLVVDQFLERLSTAN